MWAEFIRQALQRGAQRVEIQSEPKAEAFYQRVGAVTFSASPSTVFPGRMLPLMELKLS